jgi:hypothetical protein
MSVTRSGVIFMVSCAMMFVTIPKLRVMHEIAGASSAGRSVRAAVLRTWKEPSGPTTYYGVSWVAAVPDLGGRIEGHDRVEYADWAPLHPGSPVDIVVAADHRAYLTTTIYAGRGNLLFDYALLTLEITGVMVAIAGFIRLRRPS